MGVDPSTPFTDGTAWCGWCLTGHHTQCPGLMTSSLSPKKYTCRCGCKQVDLTTGEITNTPGIETKPAADGITPTSAHPNPTQTESKPATKPKPKSTKKGAACRCCQQPTKGGKFLPGHDSIYLSKLVEEVNKGRIDKDAAEQTLSDAPGLLKKLQKRLS